jgi:hypothetical protein
VKVWTVVRGAAGDPAGWRATAVCARATLSADVGLFSTTARRRVSSADARSRAALLGRMTGYCSVSDMVSPLLLEAWAAVGGKDCGQGEE